MAGSHAYLANDNSGLKVVDISNRTSPAIVGSVATPNRAQSVAVTGNYAYVATHFPSSSLEVVDISNPVSPVIVGRVRTPGKFFGAVAAAGTQAYVAVWLEGVQVVDISNPASPAIIGSVDTPGFAYGVAVANNHAYVADDTFGLQIIDISNPTSPAIVGSVYTNQARGVVVAGTHRYASCG